MRELESCSALFSLNLLLVLIVCIWSATSLQLVHSKIHLHKWDISYQFKSPDCYQKLAVTVNGDTPGPTIYAQQRDTIVVQVNNSLVTENVAIHWHGIRQSVNAYLIENDGFTNCQIGTPWFDGTQGVTQCPIQPGETFTYRFVVDRPGTYLYHAHYGMQRSAGLYGLIQVAVPDGVAEPFTYDFDRRIILNDWWHKSTYELSTGLASIPFVWVGEPQSILINGRGKFNCSLGAATAVCNATNSECDPFVLTVVPGKTYRLRIASITSLSAFNFEIEGHNLTVVEADGHYVKPFVVKNLNIYSGETYSVLITADEDPSRNYWLAVNVVSRKPGNSTGTGILNYYPNHPKRSPPTAPPTGPLWNDTMYRLNQSAAIRSHPDYIHPPPKTSDRKIILLNTQNWVDKHKKWSLNNVSLEMPNTPYLVAIKENLRHVFDERPAPETYDYKNYDIHIVQNNTNAKTGTSIYRLEFNSTVEIVLQNANMLDPKSSETHPWHLHGHDFWVLGYGIGRFDPETDPSKYNLIDPIMKNTVALYPYGWTALRFRADNPGVWAFHCHIESHFFMGMAVVFAEGVDRVGQLPPSIMGCGQLKAANSTP